MTDRQFKAVFFDLGGTLRIALLEEPWMRHARRKMAEIAGAEMPYEDFYQFVENRYAVYRKWATDENRESNDLELWTKWLLPDYNQERVRQVCHGSQLPVPAVQGPQSLGGRRAGGHPRAS